MLGSPLPPHPQLLSTIKSEPLRHACVCLHLVVKQTQQRGLFRNGSCTRHQSRQTSRALPCCLHGKGGSSMHMQRPLLSPVFCLLLMRACRAQ